MARIVLVHGIEKGVVCPAVQVPVGTGVLVIGGNYNVFRDNWIYDNWKIGIVQTWVPGVARNDNRLSAQGETSHFNRYTANHMGLGASGERLPCARIRPVIVACAWAAARIWYGEAF